MAQSLGYPPQRLHSTVQLSASDVLEDVTSYLDLALSTPALHPNARLTDRGPVAASQGESVGLALHNLKRLQSGLRGEYLIPDPALPTILPGMKKSTAKFTSAAAASDSEDQQGWQERGEFDRQQEVSDGHPDGTEPPVVREEVSIRTSQLASTLVKSDGPAAANRGKRGREPDDSRTSGQDESTRKALRKQLKKERNKAEKRAKAEKQKSNEG